MGASGRGPDGSGAPARPTRSASGAPRPWGPGPCRTRRPINSWPPSPPCTRTGMLWFGVGSSCFPLEWGEGAAGTVGGEDIFQLAEVANASPHVYALWPHVASIMLRPDEEARARV